METVWQPQAAKRHKDLKEVSLRTSSNSGWRSRHATRRASSSLEAMARLSDRAGAVGTVLQLRVDPDHKKISGTLGWC